MTIGEKIQQKRIEHGLTQLTLAEILDVSRQTISKWELGQSVPEVDKIVRMGEIFGISCDGCYCAMLMNPAKTRIRCTWEACIL